MRFLLTACLVVFAAVEVSAGTIRCEVQLGGVGTVPLYSKLGGARIGSMDTTRKDITVKGALRLIGQPGDTYAIVYDSTGKYLGVVFVPVACHIHSCF